MDVTGKVALVTGGNIGIGRAIALALAAAGADVAFTYNSHDDGATIAEIQKLGRRAYALGVDATASAEVDRVVEAAVAALGTIDILVNNVGGLVGRLPFSQLTDAHWGAVLRVNLDSAMYFTRAAARHMSHQWGRVVNVSSVAANNGGGPGSIAYATAKAAINGLTRSMAVELAPGITVNAVSPGFIVGTPFHATFTTDEQARLSVESTLVKRAGTPDDVAAVGLFLASDLAGFITGEVVQVNGGIYFD